MDPSLEALRDELLARLTTEELHQQHKFDICGLLEHDSRVDVIERSLLDLDLGAEGLPE